MTAVASASHKAPLGPTIVADFAPIAIIPVKGSLMCAPRSYVPDVAIAPSVIVNTCKTSILLSGLTTPIDHG